MDLTSAVRRAAQIRPHGMATIQGEHRQTWPQFARQVAGLAASLRELGLRPGDRVAILALNSPQYLQLIFAVWWAGGVLVPINTRLAAQEIAYIREHADVRLFITDEHFTDVAQAASSAGRHALALDAQHLSVLAAQSPMEAIQADFNALAGIFYTGGTTGRPKGVELTHSNFAFAAAAMQRDLRHDASSVFLHSSPLFHLADFGIGLAVTLATGSHSFLARFTPEAFYERLQQDGVTHIQLVPTMLALLLDSPARDDRLLRQVRSVSYGAAPISNGLLQRVLEAFPCARLQQFYGMTECCGANTMLGPEWHVLDGPQAGKLRSAGQATAGFEIRIVNPEDKELGPGQIGEIQSRGPALMRGYWQDPEQTHKAFDHGWLRSGDAGYLDEDGFLFVVDRIKDMIISGGENIYGPEVESALSTHPGVKACAVVGLPDERWGERVHAVIVAHEGAELDTADLDVHCRAKIAGYKVPRSYEFRSDPLPLSGVGKVQKNVLRDQCLQRMES